MTGLLATLRRAFACAAVSAVLLPWVAPEPSQAQAPPRPVLERGDLAVTGFSGIRPGVPVPAGANPLDGFTIDIDGPSAQILSVRDPNGPPSGQLLDRVPSWVGKARDVGQVFGITLDDGAGRTAPDLYLGAGSAFGLHIMDPNGFGAGIPKRLQRGQPGAQWMPGMWGPGAEPGTIFRVTGATGDVAPFATIPGNGGPGLASLAYNPATRSLYAADLDTGFIHHIGPDGALRSPYDHGATGRAARGLPAVVDDTIVLDTQNPAFDVTDPATWGLTPADRRVTALAVHRGRLYYAVAGGNQIWSVGLLPDGGFGPDPRWELDVGVSAPTNIVTTIIFDADGRMILAERGAQRAAYDFSVYAEPGNAAVLRYRLESPDNPATPSIWAPEREEYAIGLPPQHKAATGGAALNYAHDPQTGRLIGRSCNATLWSTGDRLRTSDDEDPANPGLPLPNDVHGLQGNEASLVRPANVPPQQSFFIDYDEMFGDEAKAGHVGLVVAWQPCGREDLTIIPPWTIPLPQPPGWLPPDYPPPREPWNANLRLTKRASPAQCIPTAAGDWACLFRVRVRNTGPDPYAGPILVHDTLPLLPAGSTFAAAAPGWACWLTGPQSMNCARPDVWLAPGAAVAFTVVVLVPREPRICAVRNHAHIEWAPGGTQMNTDPWDDADGATALIPARNCPPREDRTNLRIFKRALSQTCVRGPEGFMCGYAVQVVNMGPGVFNGPITVRDQSIPGSTIIAVSLGLPAWTCATVGPDSDCTLPPVSLVPGDGRGFLIGVRVPLEVARQFRCRIPNRANILSPPGGSAQNTNPGDDLAEALATIPGDICREERQCPPGFVLQGNICVPVAVKPPPVATCPPGTVGTPPNCARPVCPAGTTGTPPNCRPVQVGCPDGFVGRPPNCVRPVCPPGTIGTPPNCVRPVCPPGTTGTPPNCRPLQCPPGLVGTPPNCVRPVCPQGTTGTPPNCRPIVVPVCPPGTVGRPPNCFQPVCPPGQVGRPPNCRPIDVTCPPGTVGRPPNCFRPTCPPGQVGQPPNCRPIACPEGTVGRPPNCVRPTCPPGTVGRPPACIAVACPPGTVGRPPNCVRPQCPAGTVGVPPNCRPLACPPGTVGRPPNCIKPVVNQPPVINRPPVQTIPPGLINRPQPTNQGPVIR